MPRFRGHELSLLLATRQGRPALLPAKRVPSGTSFATEKAPRPRRGQALRPAPLWRQCLPRLQDRGTNENPFMTTTADAEDILGQEAAEFYRRTLQGLAVAGVPVLVGGAYALAYYT